MSEKAALHCLPNSLYMFLNLLLGGQTILDCGSDTEDKKTVKHKTLILSLAQDLVYAVSKIRKHTSSADKVEAPGRAFPSLKVHS